ncbi:unnamed protein product [Gadus morhua 'NCC']
MSRITSQVKSDVIRGGRKLNQPSVPSGSGVREGTHAQAVSRTPGPAVFRSGRRSPATLRADASLIHQH